MSVPSHGTPTPANPETSVQPGSRSRVGCESCRAKKKKCTEERPICARCFRTGVGASCVYDRPLGVRVRNKKRTANTENGLGKQQQVSSSTSPATVSSATPPVAVGGGAGAQHHRLDDGQESSRHHSYREGGARLSMNDSSRKRQRPLLPGEGAGLSPALAAAMPLSNLGSTIPPSWGVPPDPSAFVPPPAAPGGGGGPGQSFLSLPPGVDPASIPGPSFSSPTFQIAPDSFGVFLPSQQPLFGDGGGGERNGFDPTLQSSLPVSSVDYGLQQLSQGGNDNGNGEDFLQPQPQQLAGALQLLDFQSPPPPLPLPASSYSSNAAPTQSLTSATMQALSTLEYDQLQRLHNLISRRLGEQALAFTSTPAELGDFSSRQRELLHHYMTLVSPTLIALSSEDQARKQPHFLPLALRAMEVSFSVPSNRSTSTPDKTPAGGATPASLTVSGGASTSTVSTPSSTTSGSNSGPRSDETNPVLHALLAVSSAHRANLALNISNDDGAWRRQATINRAKAFQLLREFAAQAAAERKVGSPPGSSTRNREVVATTLMLLALTTLLDGDSEKFSGLLKSIKRHLSSKAFGDVSSWSAFERRVMGNICSIYEIITACSSITPDGTSLFDSSAPDLLVWDRFSPARATMVTSDGVKEVLGLSREVWDLCARTLNLVKRWDRFRETSEPGTWQEAEIRKLAGELDMELRERDDDTNKSITTRAFHAIFRSTMRVLLVREIFALPTHDEQLQAIIGASVIHFESVPFGTEIGLALPLVVLGSEALPGTGHRERLLEFFARCKWKGSASPQPVDTVLLKTWRARDEEVGWSRDCSWREIVLADHEWAFEE